MMGERRIAPLLLLTFIACLTQHLCASDQLFYEPFDESFEGRWIVSENDDYQGIWKHSKSEGHEDHGLLVSEKAKKYAIVKVLDEPVILKDGTVVLQFETRLQNGLECGGAYLKYLRPQEDGWIPNKFDNEAPYSIMFGPDKFGSTNKVHFILKHKNPKTGVYVEHHLKYPPSVPSDKLTHVYTAILKPDNELRILIDGEEKKKANFLSAENFEPALVPPQTIPDPDDKKPEDWDERAKIPDPEAVKPDDLDEDAPMEIKDEEAVKPEGWLDDEPEEIDDPEATKPEDWDDEEDGEFEAPKIDNPKCEAAPGCGEWKRPTKRNPAYKVLRRLPSRIERAWKVKYDVEKEKQKAEDEVAGLSDGLSGFQKKVFDLLYKVSDIPLLEAYKIKIIDIIEKGESKPNLTIGVLVSIRVVIATVFFRVVFGGKKPAVVAPVTKTNEEAKDAGSAEGEKEEENDKDEPAAAAPRPRRARRDT